MIAALRQNWAYWGILAIFLILVILDSFVYQMPRARVGDLIEHVSALDVWIEQPFSPENPALNSDAPSPRFIPVYLPFVWLGSLLGWSGWTAYNVISVCGALLFIFCAHRFFKALSPHKYAPLLGWLVFMGLWANPWNYSSVYAYSTLYKITAYPSIIAFSLSLLCLAILILCLKGGQITKWQTIGLAALTTIIVTSHILTGAFLLCAAALFILFSPATSKLRLQIFGAGVAGLILSLLWPFYPVGEVMAGGRVVTGEIWTQRLSVQPGRAGALLDRHSFYEWGRYYPIFLGVLAALFLAFKRQFISILGILGFGSIYLINLFVPLPLGHRFIIFSMFFGHLAIFLIVLSAWKKLVTTEKSGTIFAGLLAIGFLVLNVARLTPPLGAHNGKVLERNLKVQALTTEQSVIAGDPAAAWMLSAYDRKILWLKHPNPLVDDRYDRALASVILQTPEAPKDIVDTAQSCFGVTHLLLNQGTKKNPDEEIISLVKALKKRGLEQQIIDKSYVLFELPPANENLSCDEDEFQRMRQTIDAIYAE